MTKEHGQKLEAEKQTSLQIIPLYKSPCYTYYF